MVTQTANSSLVIRITRRCSARRAFLLDELTKRRLRASGRNVAIGIFWGTPKTANVLPPDLDPCSRLGGWRWLRCPRRHPWRAETLNLRGLPMKDRPFKPISSHEAPARRRRHLDAQGHIRIDCWCG